MAITFQTYDCSGDPLHEYTVTRVAANPYGVPGYYRLHLRREGGDKDGNQVDLPASYLDEHCPGWRNLLEDTSEDSDSVTCSSSCD